ncbi:hypothetical protein AB6805_13885 [Chitinophaga sp. RCC_12]|uniref:hypothetical protein n=1 Tax=Chitinophaga sp. RCC_12 TaxID=3239226 RepID=UPI00352632E9
MKIELKSIRLNDDLSFDSFSFTANLYVEHKRVATVIDDGMGSEYRYENIEPENRLLFHNAEQHVKSLQTSTETEAPSKSNEPLPAHYALDQYLYELLCAHVERLDQRKLNTIIKNGIAYGGGKISYRFVKFSNPVSELLKTDKGISTIEWALNKRVLPKIEPGEKILNKNIPEDIIKRAGFSEDQYTKPEQLLKAPKITTKPRKGKGL